MTQVKVNNNFSKSFDGIMNELFNEFPCTVAKTFREDVFNYPPVNIIDKPAMFQVELSVPGFEKTDFHVKLENNLLTVSTEKSEATIAETDKLIRKEFTTKSFKRSFTIDEKVDAEQIVAKYENGILILELPKKELVKGGVKDINIL